MLYSVASAPQLLIVKTCILEAYTLSSTSPPQLEVL